VVFDAEPLLAFSFDETGADAVEENAEFGGLVERFRDCPV